MSITPEQKKLILEFMKTHPVGVLSTVTPEGQTESAVVAFSEYEDFTLCIFTLINTHKYRNLEHEKRVSMVIGLGLEDNKTLQIHGVARELSSAEIAPYHKAHALKNPYSEKYLYNPDNKGFLIIPTWLRYSELSAKPPVIIEGEISQ